MFPKENIVNMHGSFTHGCTGVGKTSHYPNKTPTGN